MLTLQVLNSDAQLNNFQAYNSFAFTSGSDVTVLLRLINTDLKLRYIPAAGATFSITLLNVDETTVIKTLNNPFVDDRSILSFTISATESLTIPSQSLVVTITEGSKKTVAVLKNGLQRTNLQGC